MPAGHFQSRGSPASAGKFPKGELNGDEHDAAILDVLLEKQDEALDSLIQFNKDPRPP